MSSFTNRTEAVVNSLQAYIEKLVADTAKFAENDAKQNAPVLTGAYRDSIVAKPVVDSNDMIDGCTVGFEVTAGNEEVAYAGVIEFGSVAQNRAAHPVLIPASERAAAYMKSQAAKRGLVIE